MLKVIKTIAQWQAMTAQVHRAHLSLGCVPTMGNLHAGHMTLVAESIANNDFTVVTIFVNPTQFNNPDDLKKYPRTMSEDIARLKEAGVDFVFTPQIADMYPQDYRYQIHESRMSAVLEGAKRPGHFDGVLTIVMKLLALIKPTHAYFGEKDFQQLQLITDMVDAFFMDVKIIPCAIVRDDKALALSSRNSRLSEAGLALAQEFAGILQKPSDLETITRAIKALGIEIDYIEDAGGRRFAAVFVEGVRLIDNVEL
jgi:pantoate--beta-alanine ligase